MREKESEKDREKARKREGETERARERERERERERDFAAVLHHTDPASLQPPVSSSNSPPGYAGGGVDY